MALRRPRAALPSKAPTFSVTLPVGSEPAQAPLKLDAAVQPKVAEQLIVDLDAGTIDSPFISMVGQFPGGGGGGGMPTRSLTESGSMDELLGGPPPPAGGMPLPSIAGAGGRIPGGGIPRANSMGVLPAALATSQKKPPGGPSPTAPSPSHLANLKTQRRFFRVDQSNMYVLVNQTHVDVEDEIDGHETPLVKTDDEECIPFDELEIGEVLGSGSQGTVRAVKHKGKDLALKRISISQALDKTQADVERQARKKAIVRELQMLSHRGKRSKHLVALYNGYFKKETDEGSLHILMERMGLSAEALQAMVSKMPNQDVHRTAQRAFGEHFGGLNSIPNRGIEYIGMSAEHLKVRESPLPEIVVSLIAHDALKGLEHLHDVLRFVHIDIKPANLMLDMKYESIKVADFGCSQQLPSEHGGCIPVTNVNLGTKLYMSPERAAACYGSAEEAVGYNEGTDIWSLGISLMELCGGIHPCHEFREAYWDFADKLDMNHLVWPEQCSKLFIDFIQLMLTTKVEDRPSAAELLKHDFIKKYASVPRRKLRMYVQSVKQISQTYEQKKLQGTIEQQLKIATKTKDTAPTHRNRAVWDGFAKGIRGNVPSLDDTDKFPTL